MKLDALIERYEDFYQILRNEDYYGGNGLFQASDEIERLIKLILPIYKTSKDPVVIEKITRISDPYFENKLVVLVNTIQKAEIFYKVHKSFDGYHNVFRFALSKSDWGWAQKIVDAMDEKEAGMTLSKVVRDDIRSGKFASASRLIDMVPTSYLHNLIASSVEFFDSYPLLLEKIMKRCPMNQIIADFSANSIIFIRNEELTNYLLSFTHFSLDIEKVKRWCPFSKCVGKELILKDDEFRGFARRRLIEIEDLIPKMNALLQEYTLFTQEIDQVMGIPSFYFVWEGMRLDIVRLLAEHQELAKEYNFKLMDISFLSNMEEKLSWYF